MNPNDELFNAMLEMGCKVITERPKALMQLPKVKTSPEVSQGLVWRLIESGVKHLRSHDDVYTIYKDGEKYSLHRNGVIIGKFTTSVEARNYASNSLLNRCSLRK
jgi:hypothetical protein